MARDRLTITAVQLAGSTNAQSLVAANSGRKFLQVRNGSTSINIFISGSSAVLITTGHLVPFNDKQDLLDYIGPVWVVAASGTPLVTAIQF